MWLVVIFLLSVFNTPNGNVIVQWGLLAKGSTLVDLPTSYTTVNYSVTFNRYSTKKYSSSTSQANHNTVATSTQWWGKTVSNFSFAVSTENGCIANTWISIGF